MNILVTGGGGFLGSAVCRQLAALGHEVTAFQRRPATHLADLGIRSIEDDIGNAKAVLSAAQNIDAIVHTAGKAGIWGDPADFRRVNVEGTENVIRACRDLGIEYLVHTSSPSVVHAGGDIEDGDESLPLATEFSAPYPETKAEAEKRVLAADGPELKTVALRPHLIWGPGDPHILPRLAAKARGGRLALPAPHKVIDTIFVENAAQA
ncbi:MAG: NAD-dependent epimerase/dehydratase family protein, partial [Gammaproteobacteria bacterium]|nr:NAD-dependent epimerase/dehydratase family protein [Gammaproteobacteria bacterium]